LLYQFIIKLTNFTPKINFTVSSQVSIPKGTRDFGPIQMARRNYIFSTIRSVFEKFGFAQIETPAMENLSVLTGKYGDEGDQLIFKVLNSGDFLKDVDAEKLASGYKKVTSLVSEKALRYDLTVPFARFVVMNKNEITFPFKRYQIQPVWRADRPQKGRYREFYQCDADFVGTDSLICEAEIILMIQETLNKLGITDFTIKINNRKILSGLATAIGENGKEADICVAIDKLDKIGQEGVSKELLENGIAQSAIDKLMPVILNAGNTTEKINLLKNLFTNNEIGAKGLSEIEEVLQILKSFDANTSNVEFDIALARGLSYYTGCIFEVKVNNVSIGSISGGGRYDNLTGMFGLPNVSGVGFSFGVDRVYDVMNELNLFNHIQTSSAKVMIAHFDVETKNYGLSVLKKLRDNGISSELYYDVAKIKKQFDYANNKNIPFVIVIGSDEMNSGVLTLKDMITGEQKKLRIEKIIEELALNNRQ
jgi:histidyl-tRNA synthetase